MDLIFYHTLSLSYGNSRNLNGVRRQFGRFVCVCVRMCNQPIPHMTTCIYQHYIHARSCVQIMKISNKATLCIVPNIVKCMKVVVGEIRRLKSQFTVKIYYYRLIYQINENN